MSFKWFDNFFHSAKRSYTLEEIRDSKYGEYFEHLQQSLETYDADFAVYQSIEQILTLDPSDSDLQSRMESILTLLPDFGFQTKRMVLQKSDSDNEPWMAAGLGGGSGDLAYLDGQFFNLLENSERIFIGDTSKIRTLKFSPQRETPKTVLGLSMGGLPGYRGVLWFASPQANFLTKDEVERIEMLTSAVRTAMAHKLVLLEEQRRTMPYETFFHKMAFPAVVIGKGLILTKNHQAEDLLTSLLETDEDKLRQELLAAKEDDCRSIRLENKSYSIFWTDLRQLPGDKQFAFLLVDESLSSNQRQYIETTTEALAHNFEEPLKAIVNFSEMITLLSNLEDSQRDYLAKIQQQGDRLLTYTDDLLEIRRLNKESPLMISEIAVKTIIGEVAGAMEPLLRQKRIKFSNQVEEVEERIQVDAPLFSQAVFLTMDYMLDSLDPGNGIRVEFQKEQDCVSLVFTDDGRGISELDLATLNHPDKDSKIDRRIRITSDIIHFHSGQMVIKSELGKGSQIYLSLPFH